MFVFNEKTGKLLNLDMVSEVLVGREKNKLTIARENGAMGIFADYSTETEAREALWKLMEYEDTGLSPEEVGTLKEYQEAVEKQKPKKPTYEGDGYAPDGNFVFDEWLCPCCGSRHEVDYDDYAHCPNCGQKIDWSDEDE